MVAIGMVVLEMAALTLVLEVAVLDHELVSFVVVVLDSEMVVLEVLT